jgi:uncharacterized protein
VKRKFATFPDWGRVVSRRFVAMPLDEPGFSGHIALLTFDEIGEPGWLTYEGGRLLIADDGFCWLQYYPRDAHYAFAATFDAGGRFVYWYFDIVKGYGVGPDGIPWYDDLYLDVIVLPDSATWVLDADELDEALAVGKITRDDWHLAWDEARALLAALARAPLPVMTRREEHLALLRALPMTVLTRAGAAEGDDR